MNDFLLMWLSLSLSGSLVAATLLLLKPLLQRFSKTWQYYAWLLVILRLLIPFSPNASIVGGLFHQVETHLITQNIPANDGPEHDLSEMVQQPAASHLENAKAQESPITVTAFASVKDHIWGILWLVLAMTLLARKMIGYGRFLQAVKKQNETITDEQLSTALNTAGSAMGIKNTISICLNPLVRAPMLVGAIRPIIVLPKKTIPITELMFIFRHELTHYRRKDFFYKWLVEIAVCLHWFNPLVYWVRKQMNQDCEFSCDESVVRYLAGRDRQTYGETLLNSIVINDESKFHHVSLSLNEDGKLIKERLNAIMQYHQKSKLVVFVAVILTSVLLCGTVFAGAYTVAAVENVKPSTIAVPIRISSNGIEPGGKISLGSQPLVSGTKCQVLLNWIGNGNLTVLCTASSGFEKSYSVENDKITTFRISANGEYTIAVKNNTENRVRNVNGSIKYNQTTTNQQLQNAGIPVQPSVSPAQSIVYQNVEMRCYEGESGFPYIHDMKTNNTASTIIGYQHGMLAFDEHGNPLKIDWWSMDDEFNNDYFYLYSWDSAKINPGETTNVQGGWSLNMMGNDSSVADIAYVLYCDKEITFGDGTIWTNPDFENWRTTYEGKKIDVGILDNYYPYEQKITF